MSKKTDSAIMVETKGIMNVGMMKSIDQTSTSPPVKFDEMFQTLKRIDSKLDKLITMMFPEEITPKTSQKENETVSSPQIASSIIDYGIGELPEFSAGRTVDYAAIQVANEEIHESIVNQKLPCELTKNSTKENVVKVFDEMLLESALPLIVDKPEIGFKPPTEKPLKYVEGADSESNHSGNNFVQLVPNLLNGEWIKGWPDYSKTCDVIINDEIKIWNVAIHDKKSVLWSIKIYMYKEELEYVGYYVVMKDETIAHLIFDPGGHGSVRSIQFAQLWSSSCFQSSFKFKHSQTAQSGFLRDVNRYDPDKSKHIQRRYKDDYVYEMQYTTGSGWQKSCRKACVTAGSRSVSPRWVVPNILIFALVDPIVEIVADSERHILYARTKQMKILVFSMVLFGDESFQKVAEQRNLISQKDPPYGGRQPTRSRTISRPTKISVVCISPLSLLESQMLHLVAILSDGRRMYLTTIPSGGNSGALGGLGSLEGNHPRPSCLKVAGTMPSPLLGVGGRLEFGVLPGRSQNEELSLKIESVHYSAGALVLSDSSPSTSSLLLTVKRDSSRQTSSSGMGAGVRSTRALRELVSSLPNEGRMFFAPDVLLDAYTDAIVQSLYLQLEFCGYANPWESWKKSFGKLWAKGDLSTQHILPRRSIVIFSTVGMMELVFNRPIDILRRLLKFSFPRSLLEDFFNRYGAAKASAMCLMLASRIVYAETPINNVVAEEIRTTQGMEIGTALLYGIIGFLHKQFSKLWDPTKEWLSILTRQYLGVEWDIYVHYLDHCQSMFMRYHDQCKAPTKCISSAIDGS